MILPQESEKVRLHDLEAGKVRMDCVPGIFRTDLSRAVRQESEVVNVLDMLLLGVGAQQIVELLDLLEAVLHLRPPTDVVGSEQRADDRLDAVGLGDLAHRLDAADSCLDVNGMPRIEGDVVDAAEYDDILRFELDDILPHPDKDLRCGLSADTAADKVVVREESRIGSGPAFRDRISQ